MREATNKSLVIKEKLVLPAGYFPQRPLIDSEIMILLHKRLGHINMRKLVDGFMQNRYTGYTIPRQMLDTKSFSWIG
jgi:hypothetical protein